MIIKSCEAKYWLMLIEFLYMKVKHFYLMLRIDPKSLYLQLICNCLIAENTYNEYDYIVLF